MTDSMQQTLETLERQGNLRRLPRLTHKGRFVETDGKELLNLSSNDYLGLAADRNLRAEFLESLTPDSFLPSASSSRLLTGNYAISEQLENALATLFGSEAALVFNSGYHANTGLIPAITDSQTLILADKLIHASLIDGIRLSEARSIRYRHNDLNQLERLVARYASEYERILIVTESIFSMDGDEADLPRLVSLRRSYADKVWLYVDEAHAFGVRGKQGLGCAEEKGCTHDIDFLVGTFGKAAASVGAYIVCRKVVRDFLVNRVRPFIFTTALPPVNLMWTHFIVQRLPQMADRREHLSSLATLLRTSLQMQGLSTCSTSHIIPILAGSSTEATRLARQLQRYGFYVLPIRPPTVPEGTSRLRISLTANITQEEMQAFLTLLTDQHSPTKTNCEHL